MTGKSGDCRADWHRRLSGKDANCVSARRAAGMETFNQALWQAVEPFEYAMPLIGHGGAKKHPREHAAIASLLPVALGMTIACLGQSCT